MEISFDLNRDESFEYYERVVFTAAKRRRLYLKAIVLLLFTFAFGGFLILGPPQCPAWGWWFIGLGSAYLINVPRIQSRSLEEVGALLPKNNSKNTFWPQRIVIDEVGLTQIRTLTTLAFKWQAVERIDLSERLVLFLMQQGNALFVPRRAFVDEAALNQFVETARRYRREASQRAGEPNPNQANEATDQR